MSDSIRINGLVIETRIGVTEEERAAPRPVRIDIEMRVDVETAGRTDALTDTISYHDVISQVSSLVAGAETRLLEKLAADIAAVVLLDERVQGVAVEVFKEDPPVEETVGSASVRIVRP